jgi:hypothetical protein
MYTAYGDFACKEDTIEHFNTLTTTNNLPYEIYKDYCDNCTRSGDNITCAKCNGDNFQVNNNVKFNRSNCPNRNGNYINNDNGVLKCLRNPTTIPQGSYNNIRHCHNCSNYNNTLKCKCIQKQAHHENIRTSVLNLNNKSCSDIINNNGVLTCVPIPNIPSVTDCGCYYEFYNNYDKIVCNCRDNNYHVKTSKLNLATCNNRQNLVNRNGTVSCG